MSVWTWDLGLMFEGENVRENEKINKVTHS